MATLALRSLGLKCVNHRGKAIFRDEVTKHRWPVCPHYFVEVEGVIFDSSIRIENWEVDGFNGNLAAGDLCMKYGNEIVGNSQNPTKFAEYISKDRNWDADSLLTKPNINPFGQMLKLEFKISEIPWNFFIETAAKHFRNEIIFDDAISQRQWIEMAPSPRVMGDD